MKIISRIILLVCISLILVYLIFLTVEALFVRKTFSLSVFMQLGSILLGFGSLFYHYRKLKPKYQSEEIESALDDDLTREEVPALPIPGILKFANGLFAVWTGWSAVKLLSMNGGGDLQIRLVWILVAATLCAYTCLFIVGVGVVDFFTPSKNPTSESVQNKAQRP